MLTFLKWITGNLLGNVTDKLADAYEAKLKAETNEKKLEAELVIAQLEARQKIIIAEQRRWLTAWIRPSLALAVVLYVWKIVVWDTVLQLGVTPDPGEFVNWIVVTIIGAYFLTRPFERK